MKQLAKITSILAIVLLAGCGGDPRAEKVQDTYDYAKREIERINSDIASQLSFASINDMGGSIKTYITASMADGKEIAPIYLETPEESWCVVIQQEQTGQGILFTLEAYGESLDEPLFTDEVPVTAQF